jgi:glycogen debranching enzyme
VHARQNTSELWDIAVSTLTQLESDHGILASGKSEIYGCVFGRDSLITALLFIHVYKKSGVMYFKNRAKKILQGLAQLQGKKVNIESGEEPGKCIHEFRPERHEHLTKRKEKPWYVYPDGSMRSFDTADATQLFLIAIHEFYEATGDEAFLSEMDEFAKRALEWMFSYGDSNGDGFFDYKVHPERSYGGLFTQNWMDSEESLFHEDESKADHPIAPVEVQAYSYAALRAWSKRYTTIEPMESKRLSDAADRLKSGFHRAFVVEDESSVHLAYAIDGNGKAHYSARSSMGHALWAVCRGKLIDGILDHRAVHAIAMRLMQGDLFEPRAGIRTLSRKSRRYEANSYHNGSIWPHDSAIIALGLERQGYLWEARQVRDALLEAYSYFKTPIELFVLDRGAYGEYRSPSGQGACRQQAWSAAALCSILVDSGYAPTALSLEPVKTKEHLLQ